MINSSKNKYFCYQLADVNSQGRSDQGARFEKMLPTLAHLTMFIHVRIRRNYKTYHKGTNYAKNTQEELVIAYHC